MLSPATYSHQDRYSRHIAIRGHVPPFVKVECFRAAREGAMSQGRVGFLVLLAVALLAALPLVAPNDAAAQDQLEVFSWWTGPGEDDGLAAMVDEFRQNNPGVSFVNATVSGGAGSNAKAILAS